MQQMRGFCIISSNKMLSRAWLAFRQKHVFIVNRQSINWPMIVNRQYECEFYCKPSGEELFFSRVDEPQTYIVNSSCIFLKVLRSQIVEYSSIYLFSLDSLFSHFRPRDIRKEIVSLSILKLFIHLCDYLKVLESIITWSEMGQQTTQDKEVCYSCLWCFWYSLTGFI